jgi:1,4-alpha-glucan branching enzyme
VGATNEVTYREWAPNAKEAYLIGEFSQCPIFSRSRTCAQRLRIDEWSRTSHPMKANDFGVWEITVPPLPSGRCAIPHDSKIKVCASLKGPRSSFVEQRLDLHDPTER